MELPRSWNTVFQSRAINLMSVNAYDIMSVLYICVCLTRFVGRSDCSVPTAIIVSGNNVEGCGCHPVQSTVQHVAVMHSCMYNASHSCSEECLRHVALIA